MDKHDIRHIHVPMKGRCTTCRKVFDLTPAIQLEASKIGCAFSPCCNAVATVKSVSVKQPQFRTRRRDL